MEGALAEHDGYIRQAVVAHRGPVVKATGEGVHTVRDG